VEKILANGDYQLRRITDLADGAAFTVTLPPDNPAELSSSDLPFAIAPLGVLRAASGPPVVLLARNTAVLRLRGKPAPWSTQTPGSVDLSSDGRFLLTFDADNYIILDPTTGAELGRTPRNDPDNRGGQGISDRFATVARPAQDWVLAEYRLPRLEETARYALPGPGSVVDVAGFAVTNDHDTFVSLIGGVLSAWDRKTHRIRVEPVQLGTTAEERQWWLTHAHVLLRPGHPDEVALGAPDGTVELWNLPQHRRIGSIPTMVQNLPFETSGMTFDIAGNRLAILTPNHTVEVWDVDSRQPVRPAIPAAPVLALLGFDPDSYLLTINGSNSVGDTIASWDLGRGVMAGEMRLGSLAAYSPNGSDDGRSLRLHAGFSELSVLTLEPLPVTARQWFDRLCAIGPGGFAGTELQALPPGANTDPPCG
jgi:WD40 repeat protein